MTGRAGHVCFPSCPDRKEAVDSGKFYYSFSDHGWVSLESPQRSPSKAVYMAYIEGRSTWLPIRKPYLFDSCPFCGGDLLSPAFGTEPSFGGEGAE